MQQGEHFEQYLTKPPSVPEGLPQGVLGFMQRIVIVEPALGRQANVIQLLQEGAAPPDHVPVLLDIDAYKQLEMSPSNTDVWALLSSLRAFKNQIFFEYLTEKSVELFE